ncbi:MAG: DUF6767 domain-containing protein [Nocardioidaceae bacterium]
MPGEARCPVRPGEPCTLCQPGVSGPQDCLLVQLVMSDPDLRARLRGMRVTQAALSSRT